MATRGVVTLSSRSCKENIMGLGRMNGLCAHKPGQRVVLGVLSANDQHNRVFGQVASKYQPAFHDPSVHDITTCQSSAGVHVSETVLVQSTKSDGSFLLSSELLLLDDAVNDIGSEEKAITSENILCVPEYAKDIHRHLRKCEVKYRAKPSYMRKQPDITNCMRIILIDWLVEVAEEYKLCSETIFLAVNYLDRFLSCMSVLRGKLQLVGTAAVLLAAKYEVYPPEVDSFVYITDDTYTKKQLLRMEQHLLRVLTFDMTAPTAHQFLIQYNLEPDNLYAFTGYSLAVICPCLKDLHKLHLCAGHRPQQTIQEKYKRAKYCGASLLKPVEALPVP